MYTPQYLKGFANKGGGKGNDKGGGKGKANWGNNGKGKANWNNEGKGKGNFSKKPTGATTLATHLGQLANLVHP